MTTWGVVLLTDGVAVKPNRGVTIVVCTNEEVFGVALRSFIGLPIVLGGRIGVWDCFSGGTMIYI